MTSAILLPARILPAIAIASIVGCSNAKSEPQSTALERHLAKVETEQAALAQQTASAKPAVTTKPAATTGPATQPVDAGEGAVKVPYSVARFERPGPVRGVVVKVDLTDPRVRVKVALTDGRDPDGDGPAVGRLETVSAATRAQNLEVGLNASFFAIQGARTIFGKQVGYFVGNAAWPVGWHYGEGQLYGKPADGAKLRATMIVNNAGRVSLVDNVQQLPTDTRYAVSGSAKVLTDGIATAPADPARHPRSAVGLSADGKTLLLVAVDGRRIDWSQGVSLGELASLMKDLGASDAINLDGGGSTSLVVKDALTGAYAIANRPSERNPLTPAVDSVERPVVDLIGVDVDGQ